MKKNHENRVNYRSARVFAARFNGCSLIGKHLQEARERKNLSIRALASRLGLSPTFVSQVERGVSMPSVASLYVLATELDVSVDELFLMIKKRLAQTHVHARGKYRNSAEC